MTATAPKEGWSPALFSGDVPRSIFFAAFLLLIANILAAGLTAPLWLDENFSATIAVQPTFKKLVEWCVSELSGPLYYSLLWMWERVAGDQNIALRIPSLLFCLAAPAFLAWKGHEDRQTRYLWALSVGLWTPGFDMATEARPYSLMLLLGCVQSACFLNLIKAPTTKRAAIWAGASSLAVLTHYHAAVISGIQGIAYLLLHRRAALRTWPALLTLLPMGLWMSWHFHVVLRYATSPNTWYQLLTWKVALLAPVGLYGSLATLIALGVLLPVFLYIRASNGRMRGEALQPILPEMVLISSGILATALVVATGFFWRSFSMRYILPYVGAAALLMPIVLRDVRSVFASAPMVIVLSLIGAAVPPLAKRLAHPLNDYRYNFNFEQPSNWIMDNSSTHRLVFLWDNPTALLGKPDQLAEVGGFFFHRRGRSVDVLIPRYAMDADPYPQVAAMTKSRADTAVIWAYDYAVPNTSATRYPPRVLEHPAQWRCKNFGANTITVLACIPTASAISYQRPNK